MNEAVALYDFSPVARLMLLGIAVALGPLAWVWLRNRQAPLGHRLATLTLLTLFLTFDLVLFGAFTRLTDSGLGCPDWPGCYGAASPHGAQVEIGQAQAAMPTGPVTHSKAWIEMVHRYLATGVGVLILALAVASWLRRRELPLSPWWPTVTLAWVCLQGAFGALTVTMKLQPAIVTLHLLGGLVLLALLCRQAVRYTQARSSATTTGRSPLVLAPPLRAALAAAMALLWLQVALGGWVSTNYAVLACGYFPTFQGSWWPEMAWREGFELWRALGKTGEGEHITFAALTAIHYAHRLMAYLLIPVLLALAFGLRRAGQARQAHWLAWAVLWQAVSGLSNVVLGWPLLAAVAHTGGAAALVVVLTWAWCDSRSARAVPQGAPARSRQSQGALS